MESQAILAISKALLAVYSDGLSGSRKKSAGLQCDAEIVDHFIDFAADGFHLLDDAVTRRNEGKIIGIQVGDDGVPKMRAQYFRHLPEQLVALLNAVIGVVQFEVREVEIDRAVQSAGPVNLSIWMCSLTRL